MMMMMRKKTRNRPRKGRRKIDSDVGIPYGFWQEYKSVFDVLNPAASSYQWMTLHIRLKAQMIWFIVFRSACSLTAVNTDGSYRVPVASRFMEQRLSNCYIEQCEIT